MRTVELVDQRHLNMVLQILAYAWQIHLYLYPMFAQRVGGTDPR
jgi:hypothetical protein